MTASPLTRSLSALLKSKALGPEHLLIIDDNARLPTEELVEKIRFENSMTNFGDFSMTDLDASADFALPVWELDASGDSRWEDPSKTEASTPVCPQRSAAKMLSGTQARRSGIPLPSSLRQLPSSVYPSVKNGRCQIVDILAETIEITKSFDSAAVAGSPSLRSSSNKRSQLVRRTSPPSKDFANQCQQMKLVF